MDTYFQHPLLISNMLLDWDIIFNEQNGIFYSDESSVKWGFKLNGKDLLNKWGWCERLKEMIIPYICM